MPDDISGALTPPGTKRSGAEALKLASRGLRGRLAEELAEGGIQVSEDAYQLLKFHGSYEQFDRDTATARKQQKLEKEYQFMLRVRMPGGRLTAAQYLGLDRLADDHANGTIRITSRQGIQFHGILKGELKPAIAAVNHTLLTTICACGDVSRNVTASPAPIRDARHERLLADARELSELLKPKSRAYYEIFLDETPGFVPEAEQVETLYGPTYLPRKFKIGITVPEDNTIDVLSNDLGIVAIWEGDRLAGYNIAVGGGLGMTHNKPRTYPRLASPIAFVPPGGLLRMVHAVMGLHRDFGDRGDRRRARLKYVVDDRGLDWVRATLEDSYGEAFGPARPMTLKVPDILGWHEQGDGRLWLGVPIASGRILDDGPLRLRSALRLIAQRYGFPITVTPQHDALLCDIAPAQRAEVAALLAEHGVAAAETMTPLARFTLACPALPTCGLALTEAERLQPKHVAQMEGLLAKHGLSDRRISLRITGCPNGCVRTYTGDIGLVGRMPGYYALYVGGDFEGTRLSFRLFDRIAEAAVFETLDPLLRDYAAEGQPGEGFGDWCNRTGLEGLLGRAGQAQAAAT